MLFYPRKPILTMPDQAPPPNSSLVVLDAQ